MQTLSDVERRFPSDNTPVSMPQPASLTLAHPSPSIVPLFQTTNNGDSIRGQDIARGTAAERGLHMLCRQQSFAPAPQNTGARFVFGKGSSVGVSSPNTAREASLNEARSGGKSSCYGVCSRDGVTTAAADGRNHPQDHPHNTGHNSLSKAVDSAFLNDLCEGIKLYILIGTAVQAYPPIAVTLLMGYSSYHSNCPDHLFCFCIVQMNLISSLTLQVKICRSFP